MQSRTLSQSGGGSAGADADGNDHAGADDGDDDNGGGDHSDGGGGNGDDDGDGGDADNILAFIIIISFPVAVIKYPGKSNLRERGPI